MFLVESLLIFFAVVISYILIVIILHRKAISVLVVDMLVVSACIVPVPIGGFVII